MNPRIRYLLAALCAGVAGLLTLFFMGESSAAGERDSAIIWVARQPLPPGVQLKEELLQRVRVDGPTRRLLAPRALPSSEADSPDQWYTLAPIGVGDALTPGGNIGTQPAPLTPTGEEVGNLRVVTLATDRLAEGGPRAGEEVDLYVIPGEGKEAVRILTRTPILRVDDGMIAVLVPESLVAPVLTATEGVPVKVVRRIEGLLP